MSYYVGAGNRTWAGCKSSECPQVLTPAFAELCGARLGLYYGGMRGSSLWSLPWSLSDLAKGEGPAYSMPYRAKQDHMLAWLLKD